MARNVLVDTGFIVALLNRRDTHQRWANAQAAEFAPPWHTCESVLSEAFRLVGPHGTPQISELLRRGALRPDFELAANLEAVLKLIQKYSNVPMGLADACLVRMTEILPDSMILTTDADFRIYRRNGRQTVPCAIPR
jgi:predicted nucleic acid-binding protein